MDFTKLQYYEAVHRLKSFSKAAQELYVSQPSVTKAISSLENELGLKLVIRGAFQQVNFTPEGERFYQHARRLLTDLKIAQDEMAELADPEHQHLKLSISSFAVKWLLPKVYSDFLPAHKGYTIALNELSMNRQLQYLLDGSIDLAYTPFSESYQDYGLSAIHLTRSELFLVVSSEDEFAAEDSIPLERLDGRTVLAYPSGTLIRDKFDELCRQANIVPIIKSASAQEMVTNAIVSHENCVAFRLVNPLFAEAQEDGLSLRPFSEPVYFDEGFLFNSEKYHSGIIRDFISFVRGLLTDQSSTAFPL